MDEISAESSSVKAKEELHLLSEQVSQLYRSVPLVLLATSINATILAYIQHRFIAPATLAVWLIAVYLSVALRGYQRYRYREAAVSAGEYMRLRNQFLALTALSGVLWGLAGIVLYPLDSVAHQAFLVIVLGGMAAGAVVAYAAVIQAFIAFCVPALTPLIMRFFLAGDEIHLSLGIMSLLFAVLIMVMGRNIHAMVLTSFKLRFENISLIEYLKSAKEQAEKLNAELTVEIAERVRGEKELQRHRERLEDLVAERTAELSEANELLKKEIVERSRMEQALRAGEEHFRFLVDNAMDIITVLDSEGTILYESPAVERLMGYKPEELTGKDVFSYIHPQDCPNVLKVFQKVVQTPGDSDKIELRFRDADGSWRTIEAVGKSIVDGPNELKVIVNSRDNTERRLLEENLFRMQKLESLGILAGGLAHDFNNLLTSIIGNMDIIALDKHLGGDGKKCLQRALAAAFQAQDLTGQLLTFSKGGEPIKKTIALKEFLRESVDFALRGANVRCEFAFSNPLWLVEGDEGQLNQVINNLVINADQAMPQGGIIMVACENLSLNSASGLPLADGDYVKIAIADEGTGIPAEERIKIFDPYFTTKPGGSGLGLTICHSIVKKHGGYIDVDGNERGGATFTIILPATVRQRVHSESAENVVQKGTARLLLMDDDEMVRTVTGELLSSLGYEVTPCRDGREAASLYLGAKEEGRSFDAVLMDLTIPGGMGGKEAAKEVLRIDPQAKIIVYSGYSNDPVMAKYGDYGFCGMLTKPFKIQDLSETIYRAITAKS